MNEFKIGDAVLVSDDMNFHKAKGVIMNKISDTRYSVKVSTSKPNIKNKTYIQMRFNIDQLTKK